MSCIHRNLTLFLFDINTMFKVTKMIFFLISLFLQHHKNIINYFKCLSYIISFCGIISITNIPRIFTQIFKTCQFCICLHMLVLYFAIQFNLRCMLFEVSFINDLRYNLFSRIFPAFIQAAYG